MRLLAPNATSTLTLSTCFFPCTVCPQAFWLPSKVDGVKKAVDKPDTDTYCPARYTDPWLAPSATASFLPAMPASLQHRCYLALSVCLNQGTAAPAMAPAAPSPCSPPHLHFLTHAHTPTPHPPPHAHSGKKLRLKDLVAAKFTPVPEGEGGLYMDPITKDTFTNANKLVLLKPTGDVLLEETYKTCVKPEGRFEGIKVREKDVIKLQGGGTGFVAHDGEKVQSKKHYTLGPGSGRQDLRGQHQGPRSAGGLVFMN